MEEEEEGGFLSTVSSVSPAPSWLQGGHTIRQSHVILHYLRSGRFHQIAWEDYHSIILGQPGRHRLISACSELNAPQAFTCLKRRLGFVAAHKQDARWTLLNSPGNKVKGISDSHLLSTHKIKCSFRQGKRSAGKSDRKIDRACNVHLFWVSSVLKLNK